MYYRTGLKGHLLVSSGALVVLIGNVVLFISDNIGNERMVDILGQVLAISGVILSVFGFILIYTTERGSAQDAYRGHSILDMVLGKVTKKKNGDGSKGWQVRVRGSVYLIIREYWGRFYLMLFNGRDAWDYRKKYRGNIGDNLNPISLLQEKFNEEKNIPAGSILQIEPKYFGAISMIAPAKKDDLPRVNHILPRDAGMRHWWLFRVRVCVSYPAANIMLTFGWMKRIYKTRLNKALPIY
jgi:hypothetical protein